MSLQLLKNSICLSVCPPQGTSVDSIIRSELAVALARIALQSDILRHLDGLATICDFGANQTHPKWYAIPYVFADSPRLEKIFVTDDHTPCTFLRNFL